MKRLTENSTHKYHIIPQEYDYSVSDYNLFSPAVIAFTNGNRIGSSCIRCKNTPCIHFSSDEVRGDSDPLMSKLPLDTNREVCPFNAIVPDDMGVPQIIKDKCVGCGLCAMRCPVGAIFVNARIPLAVVVNEANDLYLDTSSEEDAQKMLNRFRGQRKGLRPDQLNPGFISALTKLIDEKRRRSPQAENILSRNLFIALGLPAAIKRSGDQNLRMDILLSDQGLLGVGDIDFNEEGALEIPRGLLDDIAVLHSRYEVPLDNIVPIAVLFRFPNKRSDYYEVVRNIREVTGISIHSLPVLALLFMAWSHVELSLKSIIDKFLVDDNKTEAIADTSSLCLGFVTPEGSEVYFMAIK